MASFLELCDRCSARVRLYVKREPGQSVLCEQCQSDLAANAAVSEKGKRKK